MIFGGGEDCRRAIQPSPVPVLATKGTWWGGETGMWRRTGVAAAALAGTAGPPRRPPESNLRGAFTTLRWRRVSSTVCYFRGPCGREEAQRAPLPRA